MQPFGDKPRKYFFLVAGIDICIMYVWECMCLGQIPAMNGQDESKVYAQIDMRS